MSNKEYHKRNCTSCHLRLSFDNKHSLASSDLARADLRRLIDARTQQRSNQAHSPDYIAGILEACRKIPGFVADTFQRKGVERKILEKVSMHEGTVVWAEANRFEFVQLCRSCGSGEGVPAFVIPIHDFEGRLVDLVAWDSPAKRVGTWLGLGWALGQSSVLRAHLSEGLPVHRTPINWLRGGGKGVVIIDAHKARGYLCDAGPLIAEDPKHRRALNAALALPLPRILVPSEATASKEG
jgi:hypothetical protein